MVEHSADVDQVWGLGLDTYRLSQPSEEDWRSVERLFVLGYEKLHSSLLQGVCQGLKLKQITLFFSIVSSSYSFFHQHALIHFEFMLAAYLKMC